MEHDKLICAAVAELNAPPLTRTRILGGLCRWASNPEIERRHPYRWGRSKEYRMSDLPSSFDNPMIWKNVGERTAPHIESFLTQYGWIQQPDKTWTKKTNNTGVSQAKLEGELDALIVWQTIIDRIVFEIEKTLNRSVEERRKLHETVRKKKDEYHKSFGCNYKYAPDDSKPSDIEEPSGV